MLPTQHLQEQAELLRERIDRLQKRHIIETDEAARFKLEQEIKADRAALAEVEAQLKRRKSEPPSAPNAAPTATIRRIELTLDPRMNLDDEYEKFVQIVSGEDTQTRLILAHGASGSGKTHLLNLYRQILEGYDRHYLDFELKEETTTVESCLEKIVAHFVEDFGIACFAEYDSFASAAHGDMTMSNWQRSLTRKFFAGLSDCTPEFPLTLFFDSYNPDLKEPSFKLWLNEVFLPYLNERTPLTAIIAGQEVIAPPSKLKRCCHPVKMNPLKLDDFRSFANAHHAAIDESIIATLHARLCGHPKFFVEFVTLMAGKGGAA